ncbi:MAG: hypothetical protein WC781_05715 [Candidatus Pacearchaeota archaeon]|jgi:hypothetical protein
MSEKIKYTKFPENLTGHIVWFREPLIVEQTIEERTPVEKDGKKMERISWKPTGEVAECQYMRVKGGFGAYARCSGRMLIGTFYKSIEDIKNNKQFQEGNTKESPNGFIPSLFDVGLREN